ncbi:MAG: dihydroxy-acid dehydratase domain-containing protein [Solirubrobacteraceae bacterium]
MEGFANRSWTRAALGFSDTQFDGRPVIGIANSASDLTTCNTHLRFVADAVKRGVLSAGGGPTVLHVAPESAVGGPLALVKDGDLIELDTATRTLTLLVPQDELDRRQSELQLPTPHFIRGYGAMFLAHILQADQGCDFDFLRGSTPPLARTDVQGT